MPFIAIPWNQPMTSPNDGLAVPVPPVLPPLAAAPIAVNSVTSRPAPATPAATYETAGTLTVLPLLTWDVIQATSAPVSRDFNWSVACAAMSGIENAIEGIIDA